MIARSIALLTLSTLVIIGCRNKEFGSLTGIWSCVEGDTSYYEIVYLENRYWVYSAEIGEMQGTYRMWGDSIEYMDQDGATFMRSKLKWISGDEFVSLDDYLAVSNAINRYVSTRQVRIKIQVDTIGLFEGDESAFASYYPGFINRMVRWENTHVLR